MGEAGCFSRIFSCSRCSCGTYSFIYSSYRLLWVLHSEPKQSSGHLKTTGDSTRVTFWIPILKALALENPLPPAIHERLCTEVGKVLNPCVRIAFSLEFFLGLFFNMKLLFILIRHIHIQDHIHSWQRWIHQWSTTDCFLCSEIVSAGWHALGKACCFLNQKGSSQFICGEYLLFL